MVTVLGSYTQMSVNRDHAPLFHSISGDRNTKQMSSNKSQEAG